ncbi:MAG: DUF192 domain-containing protein [bacterium]|nr:DUF192 domain-containing protein [bacterium]
MKKKFLFTVFLSVILFLIFIIILFSFYPKNQSQVCFKDNCFTVELAITTQERTRGLMFREKLDLDKGMLFIFENGGEYSFWMKNTLIHLDIIWINKDKEVVFISKNTQPCKSDPCPTINPDKKAQYVLELNGGITDKIGLEVGDKIIFDTEF